MTSPSDPGVLRPPAVHRPLRNEDLDQELVVLYVSAHAEQWVDVVLPPTTKGRLRYITTSGERGMDWAAHLQHPEGMIGVYLLYPLLLRTTTLYVGNTAPAPGDVQVDAPGDYIRLFDPWPQAAP
eukprot:TRINITY_DN1658_c1_g1_i8.p2 TRINITY_DN1658_c1_g1~~TRINITY_DN1658_c1_g1_i8.p2  ORF type:complete len:125 (+),score=31.26 TRINITY_DN1658_c1_g1_i8:410-784(+)